MKKDDLIRNAKYCAQSADLQRKMLWSLQKPEEADSEVQTFHCEAC